MKDERETGRKLKLVRSYNGGRNRWPFEEYCKRHDIRLQKTIPKTPQQNGVVERMNRIIEERVRCMLSHVKLPTSFWVEAMKIPVYLINSSPSIPLAGDVLKNVWLKKNVSYEHWRPLGAELLYTFQKMRGPSSTTNQDNASFSATQKKNSCIGYGTQL